MEIPRRKVELRSSGSTELLVWLIVVVSFIFWAISTSATINHGDLTTKTNRLIPDIQKLVKTTNRTSGILILHQVSQTGSIVSIGSRLNSSSKRNFK